MNVTVTVAGEGHRKRHCRPVLSPLLAQAIEPGTL